MGLRALCTRGTPPPGRRCVLEGPPLGPGGEDITWPDQVVPRGRKASSTRKIKPQTSNHILDTNVGGGPTGEATVLYQLVTILNLMRVRPTK